ncbi:MAG: kelch repeat-containing protein [Planctomycetota bacterium]
MQLLTLTLTLAASLPQAASESGAAVTLSRQPIRYAWDGGAEVPWSGPEVPAGETRAVHVPFGEAGLRAATVAYLPFRSAGAPQDAAGAGALTVASDGAPTEGRFGAGHRLEADGALRVSGAALAELGDSWTLDFWLRPSSKQARRREPIARGADSFDVWRDEEERLVLALTDGGQVRSLDPVEVGRWNHVAVAVQGVDVPSVRLVLNGVGIAKARLDPERSLTPKEVVLGGLACELDEVRLLARNLATSELGERYEARLVPGPHALRLAFADGSSETVSVWAGALTRPRLASADDWAASQREHVVPHATGARWVPAQWQRDTPDVRPMPRTTHPTVYLGDHRVWMFGGETRDGSRHSPFRNTDDTWIYHTTERRWRRITTDTAPSPRCHQSAAYSPDHDLVLLPGGWRNDDRGLQEYDDTWVFHVSEGRWERRSPGGVALPRIANSGVVYHSALKRFLLFHYQFIFAYDPVGDRWDRVPLHTLADEDGAPYMPPSASSRMVGYDPREELVVVFGGETGADDGRGYLDATMHVDIARGTLLAKLRGPAPSPRVRSAFAYDARRGHFALYGGVRGQRSERNSDLWTYDARTGTWNEIDAADPPPALGGFFDMAYEEELDEFLLLCGRHSSDIFSNDVWRLRLDPAAEGRATWVFDRAGFRELKRLAARMRVPDGASVRWSFAGSEDARGWSTASDEPPAQARFLRVTAHLVPSADGAGPELLSLGFEPAAEGEPAGEPAGVVHAAWSL